MILIVGATGMLGREVARLLLSRGERLRLLTRSPPKLDELARRGATVVQGDLIDARSLAAACQTADRVFAAAHSILGKGRYKSENVDDVGHRALIDAARGAGVSHFVYTSVMGASPDHPVDFFRTKYRIEEYLRASGSSHTILRPAAFMEFHAHTFNGKSILERGKTALLGPGTKARNFVSVRDVAQFAVIALTDPSARGRTIEIGEPQNFSNNQVAELYGQLAGITPKVSHMPAALARAMGVVLKPFHPGLSRIMYMSSLADDAYDETFDATALSKEYQVRLTTLEQFVTERVAESRQAVSS